jgi:rhamnosyltransferase
MTFPSCAILLATHNGESFLQKQLDSLFSQTYTHFTLYISDDASTDSTVEIIQAYMQQHSNIKLLCNKKRLGYVKNFEKLLCSCDEEYIAFCDQDDIWESDKLEIEMDAMLQQKSTDIPVLVHSDLSMIDGADKIINNSYFSYRNYVLGDHKNLGHILGPCGVMGNTLLINKKLKEIILPFPDKLDVHDYWIAVNCELFGKRVTLDEQLVKYRIHDNNSSNTLGSLSKKHILTTKEVHLPNLNTNRKYFLPELLARVEEEDKKVLKAYLEYLEFKTNKFDIYFNLLKYSLVKQGFFFRVKLLFKILRKKRV